MAAVKAGDVVWNITGETKGLSAALKKSGVAITAFGVGTVAALGLSIKAFAETGDEIQKMSLRTGISAESLSELKVAAELSGTSLGTVETAVKRMSKFMNDASIEMDNTAGAGGRMAGILGQIGLSVQELQGLSPEESFNKIALAIAEVPDPMTRAAVAQEVFGRAGTMLLPMLADGAAGLEAMRQKAHELGVVFDEEAADKAAGFQDALLELGLSFDSIKFALAENIIPILVDEVIPAIVGTIKTVREWMEANPNLTATIIKVTAAVGAAAAVLGPLLLVLPGIVSAFGLVTGAAGVLSGVAGFGGVAAAATGLIGVLAGPLGLAVAIGVTVFAVKSAITSYGDLREATGMVEKATARFTETDKALKESLVARGIITQEAADKLTTHNEIMEVARNRQRDTTVSTEDLVAKYGDWVNKLDATQQALLAQEGAVGGVGSSYNLLTGEVQSLAGNIWNLGDAIRSLPPMPSLGGAGPGIPGMAAGGISPGGLTLVGEGQVAGELVKLPPGAEVFTASQSARMMGGGGGPVSVTVNMGGVTIMNNQDADSLARAVASSTRRELIGLGFATS